MWGGEARSERFHEIEIIEQTRMSADHQVKKSVKRECIHSNILHFTADFSAPFTFIYRVTHQVVPWVLLTSKHKLAFLYEEHILKRNMICNTLEKANIKQP